MQTRTTRTINMYHEELTAFVARYGKRPKLPRHVAVLLAEVKAELQWRADNAKPLEQW